jgi:hypothetical protein
VAVPDPVIELIERFERNCGAYMSGGYNETQLRNEFLNPLFEALGWDMLNKQGYAEAYKDVIHEDAIKVGGFTKAPDYCFRIGGTRKFFVEAKKPSVNVKDDTSPAFQLRRYAWSAKLPLSILSDFEEFAVYDCRIKPVKTDKSSTARILYTTFEKYPDKWDEIASVFARDSILKGSFDHYVETTKGKKGTAEVDAAFLKEIESWRDSLARNLALRNPGLSQRELNYAVQTLIDRLIFLRMCEDRGIEPYMRLLGQTNGHNVYGRLFELFQQADDRYNSGLFHFRDEKGRNEAADTLTPTLKIDDKPLRDIIKNLYYPDSPYEFAVLPADILGQVYEQFLGKVIRLTAGHHAVVEDKPEVKKAGGVFYTPTYIVDYIVENTVGKLLEGKTPKQAAKLRILDPACGSGSFLIGAYQRLMDWHRDWYVEDGTQKHTKEVYQGPGGEWRLTTAERKRILLNNICGVDIDPQAVEVTQLSLLLKVLEGESDETLAKQLQLFHERALPDLSENIKCGNSLIGPDYFENRQLSLDEDEVYRVNAFDWYSEFAEIMRAGGFNAAIGNPPYIPIESMESDEKAYHQTEHSELVGKYDSSVVFILASLELLKPDGYLGFISSQTWQTGENYSKLREYLFHNAGVLQVINLPFDVFRNAYVDTGVYVISKRPVDSYQIYRFPKKAKNVDLATVDYVEVSNELITEPFYKIVLEPTATEIINRVSILPEFTEFGHITKSTQGLAGNRFQVSEGHDEFSFPFLAKGQVDRYEIDVDQVTQVDMREHSSLITYYEAEPKMLIRRLINRQDRLMATYYDKKMVFKKDINPFILLSDEDDSYFFLAIINSRLVSYLYVNTSTIATKDDFRQTTLAEIRRLPVPAYHCENPKHRKLSDLARKLSRLAVDLSVTSVPTDKRRIQRQFDAADKASDSIVYEIYGLKDKEAEAIEGLGKG